ncbi:GRF zinc finger domain-containing protein [Patellaria atrata CBS 101060]|uniref:GRF zinc finger domain-containing protein n=1 Tax=Patellaria atrata CBS 101060 TaxID=1346257 RepID=A0A9P4VLN5_9PEZI|nr:GRF zinc finger domain-containing protein [Patellaria atrata CBS 101060]
MLGKNVGTTTEDDECTDFKLALLESLNPGIRQEVLLEALLIAQGSVEDATKNLSCPTAAVSSKKRRAVGNGYQASLSCYQIKRAFEPSTEPRVKKALTRKGKTLHLYAPDDIKAHTPCSIIHNFLPSDEADALLRELLAESSTYTRETFKLFNNIVQSPHTTCFYVNTLDEAEAQKTDYVYNGSYLKDVRRTTPELRRVSRRVQTTVNAEVQRRIQEYYPGRKKLKYQSPKEWIPNAAFVNCYDGGTESVGYHSDQLTYLGPRAVIGSLSLGVSREFRIRKVVGRGEQDLKEKNVASDRADVEGQISIHLPHNSLLVMHAEMQEDWKHSIAPAQAIDPHPISENKRLNVTYRCYKESLHPRFTPKCKCGVPTVLRCVQKKRESRGRYMWMCHVNYAPGKEGCGFFKWAEFDDDGEPPWSKRIEE